MADTVRAGRRLFVDEKGNPSDTGRQIYGPDDELHPQEAKRFGVKPEKATPRRAPRRAARPGPNTAAPQGENRQAPQGETR